MIKKFPKTLFLYIYHKEEPDFWTKILEEKKKYSNIFIFNLTSEKIELSDKTIKIINSENNFTEINNFIYIARPIATYEKPINASAMAVCWVYSLMSHPHTGSVSI